MADKKFSNEEAIKFGWESLKENLGFFLIAGAIIFVIAMVPTLIQEIMKKNDSGSIRIVLNIVHFFFQIMGMLVSLGFVKVTLKLIEKKKVSVSDLFSQYPLFLKYFLAYIIYAFILICGFFLFIVPGVIWAIKLNFFPYFILEGCGVIESLKKSSQITQGSKWDLFVFGVILSLISIAGVLVFGVGILITIPIVAMAEVFVYQKLKSGFKFSENLVK
ncbi:hypothetical protein K8R66_04950 [bacterium]|nr:hypothetical protein [bacterium]